MISKRHFTSIALIILLALALYLLDETPPSPQPFQTSAPMQSPADTAATNKEQIQPSVASPSGSPAQAITRVQADKQQSGSRSIEIFGRVMDQQREPIENVLITEERYFVSARSDAAGNYRILLDLPRHRFPTLHFLRHGYSGKRIAMDKTQFQQQAIVELNLELEDDPDSVSLSGWVGNEAGIALAGVQVELTAVKPGDGDDFFLTVFTDAEGNFELEGAGAGQKHRLALKPGPEYQGYEDNDFVVSRDPERISIVLNSLKLVDIDGMILNPVMAPIADFELQVSNITTGIHTRRVVSDASGFFSLRNFPIGAINLSSRLTSSGAEYFRITGLTLTDNDYRNLILIIDKGYHQLSGRVSDEHGIGVAKAMVTMTARIHDGPVKSYSYRSQSTDQAGGFAFSSIGGGEHQLSVYANGFDNHTRLHRFDARYDQIELSLTRPD